MEGWEAGGPASQPYISSTRPAGGRSYTEGQMERSTGLTGQAVQNNVLGNSSIPETRLWT